VRHKGTARNIPVVRIGNIAAQRDQRVETTQNVLSDVYLMESRSIGGLSGAPVFIDILGARLTGREIATSGTLFVGLFRFRLVGLTSGHFTGMDDELVSIELLSTGIRPKELEKLNMGIAYVTPADKLFEGLQQFKRDEEEESKHYGETRPLAIEVGDTTPRTNVSSQLATSTVEIPETRGKKG
jgi:hypothetical protein